MKRYLIIALAFLTLFSLAACTNNSPSGETASPALTDTSPTPDSVTSPTPAPTFAIDTDRQDAIYNHDSVSAVFLGMKKSELEAGFTPGELTDSGYTPYDDYGFFVKYYGNDTVKELVIFGSDSWETFNGISSGSSVSELVAAYGEPLSLDDGVYSYYTLKNELLKEPPSLIEVDINYLYTLSFIVEDGLVTCVMFSRF